jgi:hypothetical protein
MKKIKWTIMSLAIIVSVCGAFATRPKFTCTQLTQYYYTGTGYMPAGIVDVDYICSQGSTTCTYYTTNGGITYSPCTVGVYDPCQGCIIKKPAAPTH